MPYDSVSAPSKTSVRSIPNGDATTETLFVTTQRDLPDILIVSFAGNIELVMAILSTSWSREEHFGPHL